ncbi:C4-dicarboxylate transporter/malic acid transport protein [Sulfurimonas denitrificans DSM 1251]|jgi:tellurite resistance protein|uniref:C4-dicarboxylate transporter/malic acid transport protein n=1 Tax=Sulfurimonas denitrificans (strain ATCC 33889 / DSM 1251) TaxID=326298 RepID=Q30SI5_SULDN|nr:SLAC1 anion channel family protein [Sulfurimonas denitrificans]ABB44046.1 C4-dicarboxylate transporter/malic acid transport protein [Sulfurimonas denitrificans DSM 1251]MDD3443406.1 SLAC1 anion channel family protein [Sulfurimonas denitrificans]
MENGLEINRLKFFPVMMFAIVMGLSGLTITYQKAALWLNFPSSIGEIFMYLTTAVFLVVLSIYAKKSLRYKMAVVNEFSHPVRINFFAAISISMLMLSIIYKEQFPLISAIFWYPGTFLHFYLTMYTISFWINKNQQIDHSNPAWFIPIVGNLLVPVGGIGFVDIDILIYFFSVGIFFWIILFSLILNRIIFHNQLAVKFMPTLFILIAPPAVGFIAYYKMFEVVDTFALMLFNLALFFTLLVLFMYKNFIKIKFFISWWAFVFPIAAMAISAMLMYHIKASLFFELLSYVMVAATTIIVLIVTYQTIVHIVKKEICIQE